MAQRKRYWSIYDELRGKLGYADYLAALQTFRAGLDEDPDLLDMSNWLLEYPFAQRFYPRALEAIAYLRKLGLTVVLSDGDWCSSRARSSAQGSGMPSMGAC